MNANVTKKRTVKKVVKTNDVKTKIGDDKKIGKTKVVEADVINIKTDVVKTKNIGAKTADKKIDGEKLVAAVTAALEEKLAENIVALDLRGTPCVADWFVICEGDNASHTTAIADGMIDIVKAKHAARPWLCEGGSEGRWVLVDYVDVVVHIMLTDVRKLYDLEGLWGKNNFSSSPD